MKRPLIFLLRLMFTFTALTIGFWDAAISHTSLSESNRQGLKHFNSPLPPTPKHDVALVAALDGTMYLMDTDSRKILWSFSSGQPIYSSYQASLDSDSDSDSDSDEQNASEPSDELFIDCDDDWELYIQSRRFGKLKLSLSTEEFIRSTPDISEDGQVTLGSKKTSVIVLDAKTGKVVYTYRLERSPSESRVQSAGKNPILPIEDAEELVESGSVDLEAFKQLLYIKRTDYALQSHYPKSGKVLWNVAFAEIEAAFKCREIENHFTGIYPDSKNELSAGFTDDTELQLPCQARAVVHRIRDLSLSEALSIFDTPANVYPVGLVHSLPAPNYNPLLSHLDKLPVASRSSAGRVMRSLPAPETNSGILAVLGRDAPNVNYTNKNFDIVSRSHVLPIVLLLFILSSIMGFVFYHHLAFTGLGRLNKQAEDFKVQGSTPKKKKNRRSRNNKSGANNEKRLEISLHEHKDGHHNGLPYIEGNEKKSLLTFADLVDDCVNGRRIGKLLVFNKEIAKGSNGTIVLEGIYDGRPVAVKRLVQTHHDVALKEIQNLIASDQHPNIVRWYGVEYDQDFVYLSLERCTCSLNDLIYMYSGSLQSQTVNEDQDSNFWDEYTVRLHSIMENNKDVQLWKANGYPSLQMLGLMSDVVSGLVHLHELGIIHRDLKPQNVLIIKDRSLCAKLSDMGISKRLIGDMSSLTQHATGYGSSGWQAPELLLHGRQTRAVDLFSLGCVLFFCLTGGKHPYGESLERDVNIVNNRKDLFLVENIPEAVDLFSRLLDPDPDMRLKALDVLHHPLFWRSETRLSFLRDASDRVELQDRENKSELLDELESIGAVSLNGNWDDKMETAFINNIGRYRRYKFDSVRDLLRVIRNKLNHYRELPQEIQEILGQVPEGFDSYFSSRFPKLLIEVYKVIYRHCKDEELFQKYLKSNLI